MNIDFENTGLRDQYSHKANSQSASNIINNIYLFIIINFVVVSPIAYYFGIFSSHSYAIFALCSIISIRYFFKASIQPIFLWVLFAIFSTIHTLFVAQFLGLYNFLRFFQSLLLTLPLLISSFVVAKGVIRFNEKSWRTLSKSTCFFWNAIIAFHLSGFTIKSFIDSEINAFPFVEPSHLALNFGPLIIFSAIRRYKFETLLNISSALLFVSYTPNFSILILAVISLACFMKIRPLYFIFLFMLPIFALYYSALGQVEYLQYYVGRISVDASSDNLTALVYGGGWQQALDDVQRTIGLGLGFQNMGFDYIENKYTSRQMAVFGNVANLKDGSFYASKLISEFGIFGVSACIYQMYASITSYFSSVFVGRRSEGIQSFANAVILFGGIYFFVRGMGHFSSFTFFLLVAFWVRRDAWGHLRV